MPLPICHIVFSTVGKLPPLRNELLMLAGEGTPAVVYQLAHGSDSNLRQFPDGIEIRRIRIILRSLSSRQTAAWKVFRYLEFVLRAFFILSFRRTRIIVAHDLSALLPAWAAARLTGKAIVYNAHELYGESNEVTAPLQAAWRRLDRFLCPRVDALIAPEANRASIYRDEYGAKVEPVVVPNYPIYKPPVASSLLRDFLHERGVTDSRILLYQGLFDEGRCLHRIVEAMPSVPSGIVLLMMGTGFEEYVTRLGRLVERLDLRHRVFMHPFVAYDFLHEYSCSADAGILLYRNDCRNNYFCAPNKLYEYFQAGLPVVTSNFPGLVSFVEAENLGRCVDPEDPGQIASAIAAIFSDPAPETRKEHILKKSREHWHWEVVFQDISRIYSGLQTG